MVNVKKSIKCPCCNEELWVKLHEDRTGLIANCKNCKFSLGIGNRQYFGYNTYQNERYFEHIFPLKVGEDGMSRRYCFTKIDSMTKREFKRHINSVRELIADYQKAIKDNLFR